MTDEQKLALFRTALARIAENAEAHHAGEDGARRALAVIGAQARAALVFGRDDAGDLRVSYTPASGPGIRPAVR